MEGVKNFTTFTYKTTDGETITATKNDGVVTLVGDKNGTRQMPLEDFKKEFLMTAPKLERTPQTDSIDFKGNEVAPQNDNAKKEASTGKKWGVGIASGFIPGLGQAINGEWGKAAGFFFGGIGAQFLTAKLTKNNICGLIAGSCMSILSIVDAVKNVKPKTE